MYVALPIRMVNGMCAIYGSGLSIIIIRLLSIIISKCEIWGSVLCIEVSL